MGLIIPSRNIDLTARDQIALTNLRLLLSTSVTTGALIQGKQWELLSDEWGASSTGQAWIGGSLGYYANVTQGTASSTGSGGSYNNTSTTVVDRNTTVPNSVTVTALGAYQTSAGTITLKLLKRTSAGVYDVVVSQVFAHPGGGWASVTLTTPYNVPATGTYMIGAWYNASLGGGMSGTSRAYSSSASDIGVGVGYSFVEDGTPGIGLRATYGTAPTNMTLIPPSPVSLSGAPAYADCYFLWKDDSGSASPGTDLTVELTGNGIYWATATITSPLGVGGFDGTYTPLRARAYLGGSPTGASLTPRIKTLNGKAQRIAAPALYAE